MPEEHTSTVSWADADPSVTVTTTVPYPPSDLGVTVKVAEVMPLASVLPLTTSPRVDERLPLRCRERRGHICVFGGRRIGERYGERAVVLAEVFIRELHLDGIDARVYHRHRKFDGNVPASGDDVGRAKLGARRCDSRRGARRGGRTLRSHGDECLVFRTEYDILDVQPRDLDVRRSRQTRARRWVRSRM